MCFRKTLGKAGGSDAMVKTTKVVKVPENAAMLKCWGDFS